ncbi:hypothetical protein VNI00_014006 [Paramarasmius palmivorus]|uniref:Uncharacterized protein n=1 Tax=Paramarasmius palmivorus TaxID=297713 RepID=A0AAW0BXT2_9AGAR
MGADFYDACVRLGRENIADELYGTRGTHWSAGQAIDSGCFPHFGTASFRIRSFHYSCSFRLVDYVFASAAS